VGVGRAQDGGLQRVGAVQVVDEAPGAAQQRGILLAKDGATHAGGDLRGALVLRRDRRHRRNLTVIVGLRRRRA
jgi:hypothetical protein